MLQERGRVRGKEVEFRMKSGEIRIGQYSADTIDLGGQSCLLTAINDITERNRADERIQHLNLVLRAIRGVNQLITREKDRDALIRGCCDHLVQTRGYYNAWMAMFDESGGLVNTAEVGLGDAFLPMIEMLSRGEMTACGQRALKQSAVVGIEDLLLTCTDCPLARSYAGRGALTARLEYEGNVYGLLSVSTPSHLVGDEEERYLFQEVATDIASALYTLELEEKRKRAEEMLRESEEKFSKAFRCSPNPMVILVFPGGITIDVNDSFVSTTGYGHEEVIGRTSEELSLWVKPEERAEIRQMLQERGQVRNKEVEFRMKSGEIRVGLYSADTIDVGGQLCVIAAIDDITESKQAEQALRASEEKYRALIDDMNDGFMIVRGSKVLFANRSAAEAIGRPVEDIIGGPFLENLTPASLEKSKHIYETTKSGEPPPDHEDFELQREDGTTVFVAVRFKETVYEGERAYLLLVIDITERKRAEEKIHAFERRLRSLASRLSMAEERERKRLAAGVHDQIGQPLAVLQMKLGALRETLSSTGLKEQLDEIRELVGYTIQNTRSLTFELSPPILYELGLEPALEWLVEQVQAEHGLVGRFEDDGQNKPLGDDARGFVFWVVRELLMNVVKHAEAQAVTVSVCRDDGELRVVVEDNGVGFDTSEMEQRTRGFGLFSIRERLTEFGGQFEVESEPGRGTWVTLVAPLESGGESTGGN